MRNLIAALLVASGLPASAQGTDARTSAVDKLFANYARPDVPGCAVAIADRGRVAYAKGYGTADLAWNVPITPETIFDVASDAKQFTGFAIALLANQGKLSLDDDVRRHVPELRDFGHRVTLRHMLEHTSGLPDSVMLTRLTGRVGSPQQTNEGAFAVARDIPALDFAPGTDWSYSNTNFLLLGVVAERVSGRPLADFLADEAFKPAGMTRTRYEPDPQVLVIGRAAPYVPTKSGFRVVPYPSAEGGSKGVQSTVIDMLAWGQALDSGKLGGAALAKAMQTPRKLSTGERLSYTMGLDVLPYRGALSILHGGTGTGYRSQTMRFPKLDAAVSILCNRADADHEALARRVADIWLADRLEPAAAPQAFSDAHRAAAGDYINANGHIIELRIEGDKGSAEGLTGAELQAADAGAFTFETGYRPARLERRGKDELLYTPGQGRPVLYRRFERIALSPATLAAYTGRFYSHDFGAMLTLRVERDTLQLVTPAGTAQPLTPTAPNRFLAWPITALTFERGSNSEIERLVISTPRARRVVYERER